MTAHYPPTPKLLTPKLLTNITEAVRSVLRDPDLELTLATSLDDILGWDSMDLIAVVVDEGFDPTPGRPGHDRISHPQGAALDEKAGHRPATGFQVGLEDRPAGPALRTGL